MANVAFGLVTVPTPGTVVNVAANSTPSQLGKACHGIMIQADSRNTGNIYIGTRDMNKTTRANVYCVLGVPTESFIPTFSEALTIAPNAMSLSEFFLDADVANEGALVTALIL